MSMKEYLFSRLFAMITIVGFGLIIFITALISLINSMASYHYGDVVTANNMLGDTFVGGAALLAAIFEFNYWLKIKLSKKNRKE